jgi:hypothetical protein
VSGLAAAPSLDTRFPGRYRSTINRDASCLAAKVVAGHAKQTAWMSGVGSPHLTTVADIGDRRIAGLKRVLVHSGSDSDFARPCIPRQSPPRRFLFSVLAVKETGSDRKKLTCPAAMGFERFGRHSATALKPALKLTLNAQDNGGHRISAASRPGNLPSPRREYQRETDSTLHHRPPCR